MTDSVLNLPSNRSIRRRSPARFRRTIGILAELMIVINVSQFELFADPPPQPMHESRCRLLIVHLNIVTQAEPVPVETVAELHAAMLRSLPVISKAVREFRLNERPSLQGLTIENAAESIRNNLTATAKPSADSANATVVEIRYRSSHVTDAMNLVPSIIRSYERSIDNANSIFAPPIKTVPLEIASKLKEAIQKKEVLARSYEHLRRTNQSEKLAQAEAILRQAQFDLDWLKLKARVGRFRIGIVEESIDIIAKIEAK